MIWLLGGLAVFFFAGRWIVSAVLTSAVIVGIFIMTNPGNSIAVQIPSYQELVDYPVSCDKASEQLAYLKRVQSSINLATDPDDLSEDNRYYNSRLKATIWWYAHQCNKS